MYDFKQKLPVSKDYAIFGSIAETALSVFSLCDFLQATGVRIGFGMGLPPGRHCS
jgi:hypothetical protein